MWMILSATSKIRFAIAQTEDCEHSYGARLVIFDVGMELEGHGDIFPHGHTFEQVVGLKNKAEDVFATDKANLGFIWA